MATIQLGEFVMFKGRRHVVRGVDPSGMSGRRCYLEDAETHALVEAPVGEITPNTGHGLARLAPFRPRP
jgi:hypothetical protein